MHRLPQHHGNQRAGEAEGARDPDSHNDAARFDFGAVAEEQKADEEDGKETCGYRGQWVEGVLLH